MVYLLYNKEGAEANDQGGAFKAKLALEEIKVEQIIVELSERFQDHPTQ